MGVKRKLAANRFQEVAICHFLLCVCAARDTWQLIRSVLTAKYHQQHKRPACGFNTLPSIVNPRSPCLLATLSTKWMLWRRKCLLSGAMFLIFIIHCFQNSQSITLAPRNIESHRVAGSFLWLPVLAMPSMLNIIMHHVDVIERSNSS